MIRSLVNGELLQQLRKSLKLQQATLLTLLTAVMLYRLIQKPLQKKIHHLQMLFWA